MISLDIKDTIRELFDSLLHRYQLGLKQVMKGSNIMSTVRTEIKLKSNKSVRVRIMAIGTYQNT